MLNLNVYFLCSCQFDNLGDLIINKLLIDELGKYGKVYLDISNAPIEFKRPLLQNNRVVDISTLRKKNHSWIVRQYRYYRFLYSNKISLITTSPGPIYTDKSTNIKSLMLIYYKHFMLSLLHIKQIDIGTCCSNHIYNHSSIQIPLSEKYYLRSLDSVSYFRHNLKVDSAEYIPDLCFLLGKNPTKKFIKNRIAILDLRVIEGEDELLLNWTKSIINSFQKQNFEVVIYYQVGSDYLMASKLYELLKEFSNVSFHRECIWYEDLSFFEDKMFVVSNRMHSLLIGAAYGSFPICLYNDTSVTRKILNVFDSAFSPELPLIYKDGAIPNLQYENIYNKYINRLETDFILNSQKCHSTIERIIDSL